MFKTALVVFLFAGSAFAVESEGFVRFMKGTWTLERGADSRIQMPSGKACSVDKLKAYKDVYVKMNWEPTKKGCYSINAIDLEVYDPLKSSSVRK